MFKDYSHLFAIEDGYTALNHGSFGSCPKEVMEHQFELIRHTEKLTTRFFMMEMKTLLQESLKDLAVFLGSPFEDMVFVRNATMGANAVLNSLPLQKNDEIVTTNLIYDSCNYLLHHLSKKKGIIIKTAEISFPDDNEDIITEKILNLITDKTKLIFIDHITSITSLIMPLSKIIPEAKRKGVEIFIDGAHAPGMLPIRIAEIGADYYTGNCHKWMCSPKGAGFLYINPEKQHKIEPAIISNYFNKGDTQAQKLFNSFYWLGTMDYSACCCVKKVIEHLEESVEGGWKHIMERNHQLVLRGRDIILDKLKLTEYTPEEMTGSMVSIKLNSQSEIDAKTTLDVLYLKLLHNHKIEAIFAPLLPKRERILRISAHIYNKEEDYEKLADALKLYI